MTNDLINPEALLEIIKSLSSQSQINCVLFADLFEFCSSLGLDNKDLLESLVRSLESKGFVALMTLADDPDLIISVQPM